MGREKEGGGGGGRVLKEIKISGSITSIGYEKSHIDLNHQFFSMPRNVIYFPCSYLKVKSKCSRFFSSHNNRAMLSILHCHKRGPAYK